MSTGQEPPPDTGPLVITVPGDAEVQRMLRELGAVINRLRGERDALTAERDMLAAELRGVHGELTAAGIKDDPENHWAPLMVSMLARDRRAIGAERDRHRETLEAIAASDGTCGAKARKALEPQS